ncbi:MAG: SPOR domain-containing protein [Bacteroidales bacterium]
MIKNLLIISAVIVSSFSISAQEYTQKQTITEHLRSFNAGAGNVRIFQSPRLDSLMSNQLRSAGTHLELTGNEAFITTRGYRIQIFSGNNQRESKNEAYSKETQIKSIFPMMETYVTFQSPFWKLRVGNFRTSEEAHAKLRELKQAFPKWKEMFIVRENVKFPLNDPYLP